MRKAFNAMLVAVAAFWADNSQAVEVVYPGAHRTDYPIKLLEHALSYHADKGYRLKPFGTHLPKPRAFDIMQRGEGLDVMMGTGTKKRVEAYQAVHFPILKGLNGLRIPLVSKKQVERFADVTTEAQLKALLAGQFHTWSDTKILRYNKLRLFAGTNADGLYHMLSKGRIDYFPRSVLEIQWDFERHRDLDLAIDQHVLIQYPSAFYYFVRKGNETLAHDILSGLEQALADGSFDKMFDAEYGEILRKNRIAERRVFRLHNPMLSTETPLHRAELWINHPKSTSPGGFMPIHGGLSD